MSDVPSDRPPALWDQGCAADEIRNDFVIPTIIKIARSVSPSSIIDIGCGSGYITREVITRGALTMIDWRLLDYAEDMLAFARARSNAATRVAFFLHDLRLEPRSIPKSQLGFVAYTFLDFPLTDCLSRNVADLIADRGTLLIFLPDVLEDVIEAAAQSPAILNDYRSGHCSLEKTDKFTARNVLFEANRVENVIGHFLRADLALTGLTTFRSGKGKDHYMLTFQASSG